MPKKRTTRYLPGAFKAQLGNAWFDGVEDLVNKGVVSGPKELIEQIQTPEGRESLIQESQRKIPSTVDKIKNWFKTSPWALLSPAGIIAQAVTKDEDTPLKKGFGFVKEKFQEATKEAPEEALRKQRTDFLQEMLDIARKGIPQQIQRLEQQRQTPYLEQAFGQVGGPVAGSLGATLLGQLAQSPGSEFTSGEFQGTSPFSGKLLGSLLSSLAVQGASQYGPGLYEQYGPQVAEYGRQGLQYGQQKGRSALDYLRGLLPQ